MNINSYTYESWIPWHKVLILWAIHGNEPCGTIAIQKLISQLDSWEISLKSWMLTLIPICNQKAHDLGQRQTEENLNRMFNPENKSDSYEATLAAEIREYIENSDYMLDIHSLSWWDSTFMFKSEFWNNELDEYASTMWIKEVISWWNEIYQENELRCTDDFAKSCWVKWVCIECGQHEDPNAPIVAYDAIINSLTHLWLIDWVAAYQSDMYQLHMNTLILKDKEWSFAKIRKHWDEVKAWEVIARYQDWTEINAVEDSLILLPKHWAKKGEERFYLWISV